MLSMPWQYVNGYRGVVNSLSLRVMGEVVNKSIYIKHLNTNILNATIINAANE